MNKTFREALGARFPREEKGKMKQLAKKTAESGKEIGARICKQNGKLKLGETVTGEEIIDVVWPSCEKGEDVGRFHTHPSASRCPSLADQLSTVVEGNKLECIGSAKNGDSDFRCWLWEEPDFKMAKKALKRYKSFIEGL